MLSLVMTLALLGNGGAIERVVDRDQPRIQLAAAETPESDLPYIDSLVAQARTLLAPSQTRDPAAAAVLLDEAVRAGNLEAMLLLADLTMRGDGVARDYDKAIGLLDGVVSAGSVKDASRMLGDLYRSADEAHRDPQKAVAAYQRAIDLGDVGAMLSLARMVGSGDGVPADFDRARALLDVATGAGAAKDAQLALGDLYRRADADHRNPALAAEAYQRAVDLGDAGAMMALADMVRNGEGTPADFDRARSLLEQAVAAGVVLDGSRALGDLYRSADAPHRDLVKAMEAYQRAIDLGDAWSMLALGGMVGRGEGVPQDFKRAKALLDGAVSAGLVKEGSRALGDLYSTPGTRRDPIKAAKAYQRAVDLGDAGAMIALAQIYIRGENVPQDLDKARGLFEQAIAAGAVRDGARSLGDFFRTPGAPYRDPAKAVAAYSQAADAGDPWSMLALAAMVQAGDGATPDFDRERTLLQGAIAGGAVKDGARALGDLLLAGGPHRDPAKAAASYRQAVDLGDPWAMIALGSLVGRGDGVPRDFASAKSLLDNAIGAGLLKEGSRALGDLYMAEGPERNPMAAAKAYQRAIDRGDAYALLPFALIIGKGDGIAPNFDRAIGLLDQAIAKGIDRDGWRAKGDLYRTADGHKDMAKAVEAYAKAAELGDIGAMLSLAAIVGKADGVPLDFDRAVALLETVIQKGPAKDGLRALGDLYRTADDAHRDLAKAADAYQKAADLGDAWSMMALAPMVAKGEGAPADFDKARTLLEGAIAAGLTKDGSRALGDLYRSADEAHRDLAKAAEAYQKAADLGDPWSMMALGPMVARGEGVAADFDKARTLLEGAVAAGLTMDGSRALGDLYMADGPGRDPAKAAAAYQKAADLGDPWAMMALAPLVARGEGAAADFDKARTLLEGAVAAGLTKDGSRSLGDLYRNADDAHRDLAKAAEAYQQAIDLGDPWAMMALAPMVARGEGTAQDFDKARTLVEGAIAGGIEKDGWRALGDLYRMADDAHRDPAKAAGAYEKAVALGDPWSMISLAGLLGRGDGMGADVGRAEALLEQAVAAGVVTDGSRALGDLYRTSGSPEKAVTAYEKAIANNDPWSMMAVATMAFRGEGMAKDFAKARTLYEQAAAAGAAKDASRSLGDLYMADASNRDPVKAAENYQKAVDLGDPWAMIGLAQIVGTGDGVPADFGKARTLLEGAIAGGAARDAGKILGDMYLAQKASERNTEKAAEAYKAAADAGNADANLRLAIILSERFRDPGARTQAITQFRVAAKTLGSEAVAKEMMRLNAKALIALTQQFLNDLGYSGPVNGVVGGATTASIKEYCATRKIDACDGGIVRLSLLTQLLAEGESRVE